MKKADLISRAYVLAEYDRQHKGPPGGARKIMAEAPAVDAAPVVHGRWVKVPGYATPGGDPVWKCSECSKGVHVYGIEHGTYGAEVADGQWVSCPNCGAKMDGEAEQDQKKFDVNPNCHGLGHANCEICDSPCPYR